jgi:Na+/proline symporter
MCLDVRERLHVYGHILSWLLLLVVALILNDIATEIVHAASPESTGVRIALRLALVTLLLFCVILLSWARVKWPLHISSKVNNLLQSLSEVSGVSSLHTMTTTTSGAEGGGGMRSSASAASSTLYPPGASVFQRQRTPFLHPPTLDTSNKTQQQQQPQPLAFSLQ